MRNLLTLIVATTMLSGAAFAQSAAGGVQTATGSALTTKDGAAVHTAATAQAPAPAVKHVEAKPKKKHRAKKATAKKPAAAPKASAPEAAAPATAQ